MKSLRFLLIPLLGASVLAGSLPLRAQGHAYSSDQITQMVAPIALYPDALMSQVLMASTYPNQVTETDQWVRANPGLAGSTLDSALATATWDPSVIALAKFPTVLDRMAQNITWTTDLGNAFLAQRSDVMVAVQTLRSAAYQNGTLRTNEQERVVTEGPNIVIQPSTPEVIYVPTYQPVVVYGSYWNYPSYYYPGVWNPWPGYSFVNGFAWGLGYLFGNILFGGCDWGHHDVWMDCGVINSCSLYHNSPYSGSGYGGGEYGHQQWNHHSGGVDYQNGGTGQPYGGRSRGNINSVAAGNASRVEPATLSANRGNVGRVDNGTTRRGQAPNTTRDMSRTAQRDLAADTARGPGRPTMNNPRGNSARSGMRAPIDPATFPTRGGARQTGQGSAGYLRQGTDRPAAQGLTGYNTRGGMRTPIDPATFPTRGANRQTGQDSNRMAAHGPTGYPGQGYNRTAQRGPADYASRGNNRPTVNSPSSYAARGNNRAAVNNPGSYAPRGYNRPATDGAPSYSPRSTNRPSSNGSANYSSRSYNRPSPSGPSGYARSGGGQSYSRPSAPSGRASAPSGGHAGGGSGKSGGSHGGHGGGSHR
jgi:hypothetical protein